MTYSLLGCALAIIGYGISAYIHHKKRAKRPLMCPRNAPCDTVINSPYAETLGIPNTILGMGYFFAAAALFICIAAFPDVAALTMSAAVLASGGGLFSLYLLAVQAFVIRRFCLWCLGTTLANAAIVYAAIVLVR